MKKIFFLLLFCLLGKFATAQETVQFRMRDLGNNLATLTVTFAKERRDCKVFYEYAGQKREYWVIDTKGIGESQILTVRYDYKDAILKRNGKFATLHWKEKEKPTKYGIDVSFSDVDVLFSDVASLFAVQYAENETGFYYNAPDGKTFQLDIETNSPNKFWNMNNQESQVFKLSSVYLKETITLTVFKTDESLHGLNATLNDKGKPRSVVSIVENE